MTYLVFLSKANSEEGAMKEAFGTGAKGRQNAAKNRKGTLGKQPANLPSRAENALDAVAATGAQGRKRQVQNGADPADRPQRRSQRPAPNLEREHAEANPNLYTADQHHALGTSFAPRGGVPEANRLQYSERAGISPEVESRQAHDYPHRYTQSEHNYLGGPLANDGGAGHYSRVAGPPEQGPRASRPQTLPSEPTPGDPGLSLPRTARRSSDPGLQQHLRDAMTIRPQSTQNQPEAEGNFTAAPWDKPGGFTEAPWDKPQGFTAPPKPFAQAPQPWQGKLMFGGGANQAPPPPQANAAAPQAGPKLMFGAGAAQASQQRSAPANQRPPAQSQGPAAPVFGSPQTAGPNYLPGMKQPKTGRVGDYRPPKPPKPAAAPKVPQPPKVAQPGNGQAGSTPNWNAGAGTGAPNWQASHSAAGGGQPPPSYAPGSAGNGTFNTGGPETAGPGYVPGMKLPKNPNAAPSYNPGKGTAPERRDMAARMLSEHFNIQQRPLTTLEKLATTYRASKDGKPRSDYPSYGVNLTPKTKRHPEQGQADFPVGNVPGATGGGGSGIPNWARVGARNPFRRRGSPFSGGNI